jgi:maltodextrin utilization protein YvdJ
MYLNIGQTHGVGWGQRNYHPGKKAGGNTDYGDQNMYMLEYFASEYNKSQQVMPFSIDTYVKTYWLEQYKGIYICLCIFLFLCVFICVDIFIYVEVFLLIHM